MLYDEDPELLFTSALRFTASQVYELCLHRCSDMWYSFKNVN